MTREKLINVVDRFVVLSPPIIADAIMKELEAEGNTPASSIEAFTHWLYYADSDFIKKAWNNEWMAKHLQSKLDGLICRDSQGIMGLETLIRWHQELDTTNQAILYKYIMDNHLNKWR